ncbi:LysR family transcriptional regulator [Acinetobacter sp. 1000160]|uniref:LysR family transcriptional regulator n=1 Tax=Acinetobacter sp. 1000160 TaxID=1310800 RepID=UPI0004519BB2|nr:LysR family transcriptional regulator [Acinetobacter sp. 1000160]EXB48899.1 bacterial regulatory helix-turn-helix, lysR family protein [Acinetobacter baumannii 146457]EYT22410.1 bacterial regulatory helix-turn-helix, lysR family protein [Acinetobacter sp. 1000160]
MAMPFSRFADYFIAVAKTGSLRKAADQLFISVSAVHRQIVLAEEELGVALFERLPNGLKLTLAGELLYADLRSWQKEFQATQKRLNEIQGLQRGSIDFGMIAALSESFVSTVMQSIAQQYPWINFKLRVLDSERIADLVINAELDFGLILNPKYQHQLQISAFIEMPLGFVIPKQHALAHKEKIYFSDTLEFNHIVAAEPLIIHDHVHALYKKHDFNPAHTIECNDIRMMVSLLKQNLGISIMSYLDAAPYIENGPFEFRTINDQDLHPITVALCTAPKRQLSRIAQIMMNHIIIEMEALKSRMLMNIHQ